MGKCSKCKNGHYLYKNNCLKSCPIGLRANRINFTCEEKKDFSFYWIFPSKFSCKGKCGKKSFEADCSCKHTCMRRGNCCDDFEKECRNEIEKENCKLCEDCVDGKCKKCKKNSSFDFNFKENSKDCKCKENFEYDIEEDICVPKEIAIVKKPGNYL